MLLLAYMIINGTACDYLQGHVDELRILYWDRGQITLKQNHFNVDITADT